MAETSAPHTMTCPFCGGTEYEPGFVDDVAQGRIRWLAGKLEHGMFGNAKNRTRLPQAPVLAYRCTGCSRLELFAGRAG